MQTKEQVQYSMDTIQRATLWAGNRWPRPPYALLSLTALCFILSPLQDCVAQDATLTGNWKYASEKKNEDARLTAIDKATDGLNFLMRGRARDLLREKTKPKATLEITDGGHQVAIEVEKRRIKFQTDGSPIQVKNQGETATIRAKRKDGKLTVESQGQNGVQTIVYTVSDDGTQLLLETTLMVAKIEKAVRWKSTYLRTENQ
ncbi:hypothetical protein SH139x_002189 [Planctomycetaceae bacterium SH139]